MGGTISRGSNDQKSGGVLCSDFFACSVCVGVLLACDSSDFVDTWSHSVFFPSSMSAVAARLSVISLPSSKVDNWGYWNPLKITFKTASVLIKLSKCPYWDPRSGGRNGRDFFCLTYQWYIDTYFLLPPMNCYLLPTIFCGFADSHQKPFSPDLDWVWTSNEEVLISKA